ncbi:MAG: BamA/TamA family outer membrane protein [Stagnimonas sp.]|nr:BamA/TamA family outer membrane protein [Stagnimonas sp.]
MRRIERLLLAGFLTLTSPWCAAVSLNEIIEADAAAKTAAPEAEPSAAPTTKLSTIRFAGNKTTRERTLLRELPFKPGDAVTADQLEAGRQAIQNLNLFKKVTLTQRPDGSGGVEAVYEVQEKWYVLGYPRVDANSNGEYAYGVQLDWNNVWGLNHTLRVSALSKETKRVGIGKERNLAVGYAAPQIFDSLWSLGLGSSYTERPVNDAFGQYNERLEAYQALASRALDSARPNQGWSLGAGALWTGQRTSTGAAQYGEAFGPVGVLSYRDLKLDIYSEQGLTFTSRVDAARQDFGADYDFARVTLAAIRYWRVGATPHQTVHVFGDTGMNWDGPRSVRNFTLGGVGGLRGYERGYREGNAYYRVGTEWARPLFKPWLRTVVIAEAGNVYAQPNEIEPGDVKASIGLGLRLRLPMFVNVQVEAGIAFPLAGGAPKFFAGQV